MELALAQDVILTKKKNPQNEPNDQVTIALKAVIPEKHVH